jgi:hypothetical protein
LSTNLVPSDDAVAILEKIIREDKNESPQPSDPVTIVNKPVEVVMPPISSLPIPNAGESPTPTPRPESTSLPPGTEWKALTLYHTLQERDDTKEAHHHRQINSDRLSQELTKQIVIKKAQLDLERDAEQHYFSEVILRDVESYHRECREREVKKRISNEEYKQLLMTQKHWDSKRRDVDEREAERVEVMRQRELFESDERERKERKKLQQLSYRSELLKQMKERQRMSGPDTVMTSTERSINRSELNRLKDDRAKYEKVKLMLGVSPCVSPPSSATPSALSSSPVKRGRRLKGHEGVE